MNFNPDMLYSQFIKKNIFYVTPVILKEIGLRAHLNLDLPSRDLKNSDLEDAIRHLLELITACQTDPPRVYREGDYPLALTLTDFQLFQKYSAEVFENINEALIYFIFHRLKQDKKRKQAERITGLIDKKLQQIQTWIVHLTQLPDEVVQRKELQRVGELILAQLHQIPAGVASADIIDLFDPMQRRISIKLDSTLSARENAELYFQRAREVSDKMRKNKENLRHLQSQQKQLYHYHDLIKNNPTDKNLSAIESKLIELRIMQTDDERMQEIYRPYRSYLYENWEIWVGKSAKDNDQLTFHWAHKEDFWLHAQGVSGSHVIIRKPQRKQDPPKSVLEYAARLAAGNSQARTSSYVPVIYTRVKYLRKPRGSEAGAVIPERTKSIFVEPLVK
jgi:predicted ribosome quality control (RQC) complex YloA/Tae2 family protein